MKAFKALFVLSALLLIFSPGVFAQQKAVKKDSVHRITYTCTMHPEVIRDKPGKCPKCGMNLVEKKNSGNKKAKMKMP